jgi:hypothetical protein
VHRRFSLAGGLSTAFDSTAFDKATLVRQKPTRFQTGAARCVRLMFHP